MSVRDLILSICLALVLPISVSAETSKEQEPDWPELWSFLDEIGSAFQNVTESSQQEPDRLKLERLELQQEKNASALEKSELTSERQSLLEERKQFEEDKTRLQERERLYAGIGKDLAKANKKLKRGWIWLLLAALAGAVVDRLADHLLN